MEPAKLRQLADETDAWIAKYPTLEGRWQREELVAAVRGAADEIDRLLARAHLDGLSGPREEGS